MALLVGNTNLRYGSLPQLNTFPNDIGAGLACAPTAVANALPALNIDGLLADPLSPTSWQSLYDTRNDLGSNYFYTSGNWAKAVAINGSPQYKVAEGSPPALVLKGTIDYIARKKAESGFKTPITVNALGLTLVPAIEQNFAGFDVEAVVNGNPVQTPSFYEYQDYFTAINPGETRGILDYLILSLARGPVVFGGFYPWGGHALLATSIEVDDNNANGILEKGEGRIFIIDPLNPSTAYSPAIGAEITGGIEGFNTVQNTGTPNILSGDIWQDEDGFLKVEYSQSSLIPRPTRNSFILDTDFGDASSGALSSSPLPITVNVALAMAINTSGLSENLDKQLGTQANATPGLLDFGFLRQDLDTADAVISGYIYSNESSAYANEFFYYECLDQYGTIRSVDPLTGQNLTIRPGESGYSAAAWALAQELTGPNGAATIEHRESADTETLTAFSLDIGQLRTAYLAPIALTSAGDRWVPFSAGNADGKQHFQSTGALSWRMEDLYNLGDADFNDLHMSLLITGISA